MLYTSISNEKIKKIKKLQTKKYRDRENLFLVETENLIEEAFKAGFLKEILVLENETFKLDIETNYVSLPVMKYLSQLNTPSKVIGICEKPNEKEITGNIIMLDNIQDPGNLGTIIRSAVAFNIDTIILSPNCADMYSDKVIRSSEGMIFNANILIKSLDEMVTKLKKEDYHIYGTYVTSGKELIKILFTISKSSLL